MMEQQMEMAFMKEGGVLKDDGMNKDPVSGNEVPSGSMAKEVRDDIPAQLSEGEYVVPADVVRYHGVQTFEDLRDQAKQGFGAMEKDGRIGGQPVEDDFPIPVSQLQTYDEGGDVDTYEETFGQPFTPGQRYGSLTAPVGRGYELINYTSPDGTRSIVIPHFNGKPMSAIPSGFVAQGTSDTGASGASTPMGDDEDRLDATAKRNLATQGSMPATDMSVLQGGERTQPKAPDEFLQDDYLTYYNQTQGITDNIFRQVPILGDLVAFQDAKIRDNAIDALKTNRFDLSQEQFDAMYKLATEPPQQSLLGRLFGQQDFTPDAELKDLTYDAYSKKGQETGAITTAGLPPASPLSAEGLTRSKLKTMPKGTILNKGQVDSYIQDIGKDAMFKGNIANIATKLMFGIREDDKGNPVMGKDDEPVTAEALNRIDDNVQVHEQIQDNLNREDKGRMSRGEGPMSVQERFERHHEQFTGFTSSGEFVPGLRQETPSVGLGGQDNIGGVSSPAPDITAEIMANKGGLASKPKAKTKRKKNTKGLGTKPKAT
jgi:hypothetical protein